MPEPRSLQEMLYVTPSHQPGYILRYKDGNWFIENEKYGSQLTCNPIDAVIWQIFDSEKTIKEGLDFLKSKYKVPHEVIESDVLEVLQTFERFGAMSMLSQSRHGKTYITCAGRIDGAGSQILGTMSTIAYARQFGLQYVHTPMQYCDHNVDNSIIWTASWELFFNLGFGEITPQEIEVENLDIVRLAMSTYQISGLPMGLEHVVEKPGTLYVVPHCFDYTDSDIDSYLAVLDSLRHKYAASSFKKTSYFNTEKVNIAVHIRRDEVSHAGNERNTSDATITGYLNLLLDTLTGWDTEVHLYSSGSASAEDFTAYFDAGDFRILETADPPGSNTWNTRVESTFKDRKIYLHLNESAFTTFHQMVCADVLITSKSAFAYTAALLSKGVVLCPPFWLTSLPDWVSIDEKQGLFDRQLIISRLQKKRKTNIDS